MTATQMSNYKIVTYNWTGTEPNLSNYTLYVLTDSSKLYSTKKVGNKGRLVDK